MYRAGLRCIRKVSQKAVTESTWEGCHWEWLASACAHAEVVRAEETSLCGLAQTVQLRPLVITCFALLQKKAEFIVKLHDRFHCLKSSAVVMPHSASFLRPNFIVFISPSCFFILWIFWHVNIFVFCL